MNAFRSALQAKCTERAVCSRLPNRKPEIRGTSCITDGVKGRYAIEPGGWHLLSTRSIHTLLLHLHLAWSVDASTLSDIINVTLCSGVYLRYWLYIDVEGANLLFSTNGGVYIYIYINIQLANLLSALHVVFHYDLLTTTVSSCLLYVGFIPVSFFNKG